VGNKVKWVALIAYTTGEERMDGMAMLRMKCCRINVLG